LESLLVAPEYSRPSEEEGPESESASAEELQKAGRFSTAIEKLEGELAKQPQSFDLRLKLAEAYGRYCGNVEHAEKIVREIEAAAGFSPAQVQTAQNQLQAWRSARPARAA
jgi:hypothetical protein